MPDIQRLRCVHCHTTETPLWRTGPDGPRSLCNACGVRYKKGKLILYKDDQGNLTAVKRQDALPVHVPPPAKKSIKRNSIQTSSPPPVPSSPTSDASTKRPARKSSSDAVQPVVVAKKPRSRSRRVNAGQLPGRYVCAQFPFDSNQQPWRSPTDSPSSTPSSPAHSPRVSADRSTTLTTSSVVTDDFNPLHRTPLADEDHLFTDMACLGLDASADPDNNTLLSMPADPSSAEQFSFAFSGLGRDAYLAFDAPDRVEALRALLLDQTRAIYQLYDSTVQAVYRLYEYRCQHKLEMVHGAGDRFGGVEDCKSFVRSFARIDTSGPIANGVSHSPGVGGERMCGRKVTCPTVMLPEKTLHSAAAENLRNLMDSTDLAGFAEVCLVEMLAEDIAILARRLLVGYDPKLSRRLGDRGLSPPKVIATQG